MIHSDTECETRPLMNPEMAIIDATAAAEGKDAAGTLEARSAAQRLPVCAWPSCQSQRPASRRPRAAKKLFSSSKLSRAMAPGRRPFAATEKQLET